jgi:hypothetical protein
MYSPRSWSVSADADILIIAMAMDAPSKSNTIDTVVEVGKPIVLYKSSIITSEIITAKNITRTSEKVNCAGKNKPLRAISIKPLEKVAPITMPKLATIKMVRKEAILDPIAEFRKFTASLDTPIIRSENARIKRKIIKTR